MERGCGRTGSCGAALRASRQCPGAKISERVLVEANILKRPETARPRSCKKLAWIWGGRHVGSGPASRDLGSRRPRGELIGAGRRVEKRRGASNAPIAAAPARDERVRGCDIRPRNPPQEVENAQNQLDHAGRFCKGTFGWPSWMARRPNYGPRDGVAAAFHDNGRYRERRRGAREIRRKALKKFKTGSGAADRVGHRHGWPRKPPILSHRAAMTDRFGLAIARENQRKRLKKLKTNSRTTPWPPRLSCPSSALR